MKKRIKGYENNYYITRDGEIYSIPRNGTVSFERKKCLNKNKFGYYQVVLMKDNIAKTHLVHRLVAETFIDNPLGLEQVNHKDGNKQNNNVSNLEWCSKKYNTQHAFNNNLNNFKKRALEQLKKINDISSYKKVILKKGDECYTFETTKDASEFLNTHKDNITRAFRKNQKCKGYYVECIRPANGEALASKVEGNPVGNSGNREPVSTIPQKGSRADFVTVRNGVLASASKI